MRIKKFYVAIMLIAFAFFTVTCEEDGPSTESLLLGKWEITTIVYTGYVQGVQILQETETYGANELVVEFLDGGVGYAYEDGSQVDTFVWSLDGKKMTFPPFGLERVTGDVKVTKTNLTVTWSEEEIDDGITYRIEYQINAVKISG